MPASDPGAGAAPNVASNPAPSRTGDPAPSPAGDPAYAPLTQAFDALRLRDYDAAILYFR